MADANEPATKTPWHLWVVGILSLLWNAIGAMDFTMTQLKNEAYLKAFTPEQLAYFFSFPLVVVLAWGVATWGSLLGSVLLLLRNRWALRVNFLVLVGMTVTFIHNFVLSEGMKIMGGVVPLIFTATIIVVGVLLFVYARAMIRRGVLR
ncbi:hypothetical protein Verru16b_03026 [Lacunisphaera limnophila]|uniref:Uncharacterized protein n=1 Tax=Lacunisphaera limnophila TaxID=1838286 RepID=A0A1D8AYI1_9BACT|nr:hypothetical protein [Lacunisphaera limnophila]AOS45935.1 hypothetical protein Verru16b_03026 [Lacunisphaera limnophila]